MVLTPVICGSCKSTAEVNLLTTAACGNCGSDDLDFFEGSVTAAATPYGEIRVWADGFGTWHASVALDDHSINAAQKPEVAAAALEAIRNELHERSNGRTSGGPAAYDPATTGVKFEGASNSPDGQYLAYFVETNIHDASLHEAAKGRYVVRHDKYGDSYHHQTIELARRERDHPQTVPAGEWYIWDRIEKRRVDDDETDQHKQAELGEPERTMCPRCGTAQYNPQAGYCPQCGYRKTAAMPPDWERNPNIVGKATCPTCGDEVPVPETLVRNTGRFICSNGHTFPYRKTGSVPDTRTDEWDGTDPLLPFPEPTTFGSLRVEADEDIATTIRNNLKKDDEYGYAVPGDLVDALNDDEAKSVWTKLVGQPIPPLYYDTGMGEQHARRYRAHNLVTDHLIRRQMKSGAAYPPEGSKPRHSSPQAWRRLREHVTESELRDIAKDIAGHAGGDHEAIADALIHHDWQEGYHQGSLQTVAYPKGRSSYEPGRSRMGEPTPQTHPHKFSDEDVVAEIKHLMKTNRDYEEAGGNPTDTPNIRRTLAYTKLLRHLSDRKKKRGSLHTATDEEHWLDRARRVSSGQGKGIEHEQIDHVTAGMLTQIHDALSPANQAKFKRMSLEKAVDVGWKLVNRHKSSLQRMAVTDDMLLRTTAVVELTSGEPYGETQVREDIHDGDVFHVADTNIYGVLVEAWPCVLTEKDADDTGMHTFTMSAIDKPENQKYKAAFQEAYRLQGLPFPTTAGLHGAAEQCQFPGCSNAARSSSTYCPVHDVWAQHLRDVNSKLMEITAGILDTNPGMNREAAVRLAATTLERFPKLAGPPPPDVVEDMPHTLQRMVQEFQRNHQQQVAQ